MLVDPSEAGALPRTPPSGSACGGLTHVPKTPNGKKDGWSQQRQRANESFFSLRTTMGPRQSEPPPNADLAHNDHTHHHPRPQHHKRMRVF